MVCQGHLTIMGWVQCPLSFQRKTSDLNLIFLLWWLMSSRTNYLFGIWSLKACLCEQKVQCLILLTHLFSPGLWLWERSSAGSWYCPLCFSLQGFTSCQFSLEPDLCPVIWIVKYLVSVGAHFNNLSETRLQEYLSPFPLLLSCTIWFTRNHHNPLPYLHMDSSFPENLKATKEQSHTVILFLFCAVEIEMLGFSPRSLLFHCKSRVSRAISSKWGAKISTMKSENCSTEGR